MMQLIDTKNKEPFLRREKNLLNYGSSLITNPEQETSGKLRKFS